MPNLQFARKTHDLLYYLENPRIYDIGKVSSILALDDHLQHVVSNVHSLALLFAHTPFSVLISFGNFLSKKRCFTRMKSVSSPMDCSVKFLIKYCIRKRNSGVRGEEFSLTNKRETRRREYP
jgi:hypothetical protein